ncbi:hypothetical protein [Candidatus Parabeggiatoa sp. HSG14]|uniref:hypothetical protein n=1 Tax=Candidatus Parabeggiatoa sp. HSG14 TaxID=3055593 RepID=UPI0025A7A853|nr:hypothetical protein [Thiotrichales bacterium HSG14]
MPEDNRQCWFWNIDLDNQQYFKDQLNKYGQLRQGWGYFEKLDLRNLKKKINNKIPLDKQEQQVWNRYGVVLNSINGIKIGDLIVVKNIPDRSHFTLVRVMGKYDFNMDEKKGDFGHFLPIEIIGECYKYSEIVTSSLLHRLRQVNSPVVLAEKHRQAIINLAAVLTDLALKKQIEKIPILDQEEEPAYLLVWIWQHIVEQIGEAGAIVAVIIAIMELASVIVGLSVDTPFLWRMLFGER